MIDTRNIEIPCDFGISYGGFNHAPYHSQFQIPNLSIINQNVREILRNTSQNFRQQG